MDCLSRVSKQPVGSCSLSYLNMCDASVLFSPLPAVNRQRDAWRGASEAEKARQRLEQELSKRYNVSVCDLS